MATLTRQPKLVETARGDRPRPEKSFEKLPDRWTRGRSSATTTQVRTQARLTPRCFSSAADVANPLVHSSMTPYEQNVSRTCNQDATKRSVLIRTHKARGVDSSTADWPAKK